MPATAIRLLLTTALAGGLFSQAALAQDAIAQSTPADRDDISRLKPPPSAVARQPQEGPADVSAPGGAEVLPDIVVTGRFIPNEIRRTPEVVTVLSTAEIARTGEGDIAGALQRITGLSVVGSGFVYVRGLGERYSLALLNGSPIPSPEPLRRTVPLDIFPTGLLASSLVQKSYSANFPGEFGGGAINLTTKAIPEEAYFKVGAGISGNSETSMQTGYTYYGSKTDWLGYDNGPRSLPRGLADAIATNRQIVAGPNFSVDQIKGFTTSLTNSATTLIQRNYELPPNFSVDVEAGKAWDIGEDRLGLIFSAGYSHGWRTRGGITQLTTGVTAGPNSTQVLNLNQDFRFLETQNRILFNALAGVGYEFGENRVRWTNLIIRDTVKEARIDRGFDVEVGDPELQRLGTSYFQRQLLSTQLAGEFELATDLKLDLRGNLARSKRDAPYERRSSYQFSAQVNDFVNNLTGQGQDSRISFSDLTDEVAGASADLSYRVPAGIPLALSAGYTYFNNRRDSVRRDFRFLPQDALPAEVAQQRLDYLLSDFNVQTYDILLTETTVPGNATAFRAGLRTHAGYGQVEVEPADGVRATLGVRYEDGRQFIEPRSLLGGGDVLPQTLIRNDYWLPAGTITWNFAEDMQLRASGSKTIARPQFRELAPQQYRDLETGRTFFGNPFLQDSTLTNADLRYEWYPSRNDRLLLGAFWKQIDRPIEAITFATGGSISQSFANAPKAELYGFEAEAQYYLPLGVEGGWFADRRVVFIGNYTYTKSKLKVGAGDTTIPPGISGALQAASLIFQDGQRLTGQSDHLVNVQLSLEHPDRLSQQTLLLNYASDRVTTRGLPGTPDLIERPGVRLDFVLREGFELWGRDLEVKFEARNLLNTRYQEAQTLGTSRIFNNRYDLGQTYSLSVAYTF